MKNEIYGSSRTVPVPSKKPPVPLRFSLVTEDMKNFVKQNEDGIHNLYKDHKGNVTIGYGQKIPDAEAIREKYSCWKRTGWNYQGGGDPFSR